MGKARYMMLFALLPALHAHAGSPNDSTRVKRAVECPQRITRTVKTNLLPVFWASIPYTSEFRIVQEVPVSLFQSSQIGFSFIRKSIFLTMTENSARQGNEPRIKVNGFRIQYSHRFFYKKNDYAPHGPYIGPHISYTTAKFATKYSMQYDNYLQATHFNVNLMAGFQAISDDGFVIDVFAGIGYKKNHWEAHNSKGIATIDLTDIPYYSSPFKISAGFNLGWAF